MASSPKKAHRPAIRLAQPPLAAEPVAPPAPAAEISAPALTEELSAPTAEPPVVEQPVVEAPVAEIAPPPVVEVAQPQAPQLVEAPATVVEAVATPAPLKAPEAVKEYGEKLRGLVEKGLFESRAKFGQVKIVAEEASAAVEASYGAARDGVVALNLKAIEGLKAGLDANFDLVASLAAAKSLSELVTLQSEFARKRFEETSSQGRALAELARKVADDTVAPIKAHVAKTFKVAV